MFENLQYNGEQYVRGYGQGRGRGRPPQNGRCCGRGCGRQPERSHCYIHGTCAHISAQCATPGPNHNIEETFANMLGSNTQGRYWVNK